MTNEIRELGVELETVSGGAFAGIRELIAVTQIQTSNANGATLAGAEKQRVAGAIDLSPLQTVGRGGAYHR